MRLRESSEVGWLMLQIMGALCMPHVTRDAQLRADARGKLLEGRRFGMAGRMSGKAAALRFLEDSWPGAGTDSETGAAQPQTRSPEPAPCPRCGAALGGMYGSVCMNCDTYPADEVTADVIALDPRHQPLPPTEPDEVTTTMQHEATGEDALEDAFCSKLEACHCAAPSQAMGEMRWALEICNHDARRSLPMLVLYYLDGRGLIEHGSSLGACWLTKAGEELLDWLKKNRVDPLPPARWCDG